MKNVSRAAQLLRNDTSRVPSVPQRVKAPGLSVRWCGFDSWAQRTGLRIWCCSSHKVAAVPWIQYADPDLSIYLLFPSGREGGSEVT